MGTLLLVAGAIRTSLEKVWAVRILTVKKADNGMDQGNSRLSKRGEEGKIRRISTTSWLKMFPPRLGVKGSLGAAYYLNRTWSAVAASNWTGIEAIPTGSATKDDHFLRGSNIGPAAPHSVGYSSATFLGGGRRMRFSASDSSAGVEKKESASLSLLSAGSEPRLTVPRPSQGIIGPNGAWCPPFHPCPGIDIAAYQPVASIEPWLIIRIRYCLANHANGDFVVRTYVGHP
ncbi:hypothetical protein An15g03470 [Aspergillus niger]|uniref:Uncharacterized protein n=3 Tax=Aspergillus niger TaxID=5061 RepID=A2R5C7_ASPNC|nr:hypothetical protein An15g03470 [Aspergillus niger]CAK42422.1 hypothetical protein An15g03470 [Aspergillus niger]